MTSVYRILRRPYATKPLDGEGAYRFGGRWSSPGTRLAYTAEHLSLAMLEYFVHIDPEDLPTDLVLVVADVPAGVSRSVVSPRRLLCPSKLATIGDQFVHDHRAAILIVPSALAPAESNWLINPFHPDFARIRTHPPQPFDYDPRLFARTVAPR